MKFPKDSRYALLVMDRQKSLQCVDLYNQVKLPEGVSEEEWLAVATTEVFNELNLLAGALADICTEESCPVMSAGQYTFAWADGVKVKTPIKLSAPRYIESVLLWVEQQLADQSFLPVEPGQPFPPHFRKGIQNIFKRLFRIYAHVFHSHFKQLEELQADAALNLSFKTFVYYVKEFHLVEDQELAPLKDLVRLTWQHRETGGAPETGELKQEVAPCKEASEPAADTAAEGTAKATLSLSAGDAASVQKPQAGE
jgi:MOB kinase activator 1